LDLALRIRVGLLALKFWHSYGIGGLGLMEHTIISTRCVRPRNLFDSLLQ
jgi:hypothetical protein